MVATLSRSFPGIPADRAGRIAYFAKRIADREARDPKASVRALYLIASQFTPPAGLTLSEHHEQRRRALACEAWCAHQLGLHDECVNALFLARTHKRLARFARQEGR